MNTRFPNIKTTKPRMKPKPRLPIRSNTIAKTGERMTRMMFGIESKMPASPRPRK